MLIIQRQMNTVHIRRVEYADLEACCMLENLCFDEMEIAPRDFIEKRIELYPDGFYVAEIEGRLVGMVNSGATHREDITDEGLKYLSGHVRNGRNAVIFSLAVHPDFRRRGIGRALVEQMIRVAAEKEKQRVLLLCQEERISLYTTMGFVKVGLVTSNFGGRLLHQLEYMLPAPAWMTTNHHDSTSLQWQ